MEFWPAGGKPGPFWVQRTSCPPWALPGLLVTPSRHGRVSAVHALPLHHWLPWAWKLLPVAAGGPHGPGPGPATSAACVLQSACLPTAVSPGQCSRGPIAGLSAEASEWFSPALGEGWGGGTAPGWFSSVGLAVTPAHLVPGSRLCPASPSPSALPSPGEKSLLWSPGTTC